MKTILLLIGFILASIHVGAQQPKKVLRMGYLSTFNPSSILLVVVLLAIAVIAEAQQPKKVPRIGYLSSVDPARESARSEPFRAALRELGYKEGQNITFDHRYSEGKRDRYPEQCNNSD